MKLLDGRELAGFIKERQAAEVRRLASLGATPKLAIVACGQNEVSTLYMKIKQRYGADIGAEVAVEHMQPADLLSGVERLNHDASVHGVIVQLPLPEGLDETAVLNAVAPGKDVDGLGQNAGFDPATPTAILWLLSGYNIELRGKNIGVVGQGRLVGRPLADMLEASGHQPVRLDEHSTDLAESLRVADIIISAAGHPGLITPDLVKAGAVVVDAGTAAENGQIKGDVAPELRRREHIVITPEKGGVGPLTVAALFDNLLRATRAQISK